MLKFDKVSFFYENEALFRDFCIEISENEVTGVLGHSGCGKTTLMELSCGMLKPFSGSVTPFSASRPSFVFQEDRLLPQKTALENITFVGASPKRAREYLAKVGLEGCEGKLPEENRFQPSRCQPCRKRHCMLFCNPNIEKPLREHVMKTF